MKQNLDIESWNRKEHYKFFKNFEEPFFGVTVEIECTKSYELCKLNEKSFFLFYLFKTITAANRIEHFKYRIEGDSIVVYDKVNVSPTINRPDGTFGFAYIDFYEDFDLFSHHANIEIERVKASKGLIPAISGENVIHFSSIPWIKFTSLSHARCYRFKDSCPKITFGKMFMEGNLKKMPVSIHVHHALMDGYQVGQFVDLLQELMG